MKTLSLSQMEDLQGAADQRNCMIIGGVIVGSAIAGFFTGVAWGATAAAVLAGANSNCF